jgi:hypothetical protein
MRGHTGREGQTMHDSNEADQRKREEIEGGMRCNVID